MIRKTDRQGEIKENTLFKKIHDLLEIETKCGQDFSTEHSEDFLKRNLYIQAERC